MGTALTEQENLEKLLTNIFTSISRLQELSVLPFSFIMMILQT
jgi:hypothetical protein